MLITITVYELGRRGHLTPAEIEVANRSVRGLGNKQIATALGCSCATVRSHLLNIFRKLGISSRGELAYLVMRVLAGELVAFAPQRPHRHRPAQRA